MCRHYLLPVISELTVSNTLLSMVKSVDQSKGFQHVRLVMFVPWYLTFVLQ